MIAIILFPHNYKNYKYKIEISTCIKIIIINYAFDATSRLFFLTKLFSHTRKLSHFSLRAVLKMEVISMKQ